jgi:hypothetical protein
MGNVGSPLNRMVRVRLNEVVAPSAAPAREATSALVASATTTVVPIRLANDDTFVPPEASPGASA